MPRPHKTIHISAFPAGPRPSETPEQDSPRGKTQGRVRVAWMTRGKYTWRVEFEEGREFAAALAVLDYSQAGGPFGLDWFEATMLAAQILDTSESKFRSISEHVARALESNPVPMRQAA